MRDQLDKLQKAMSGTRPAPEEQNEFIEVAQSIASLALASYRGRLLDRALDIAKAIIEYDIEMRYPNAQAD